MLTQHDGEGIVRPGEGWHCPTIVVSRRGICMLDPADPNKDNFFFGGIDECRFRWGARADWQGRLGAVRSIFSDPAAGALWSRAIRSCCTSSWKSSTRSSASPR